MPAPKGHPPYNKNGEGGRPLEWTDERIDEVADKLDVWGEGKGNIFIQFFLYENHLTAKMAAEWKERHERFRKSYERILLKQQAVVFQGALTKKFNTQFSQFVLNVNHGIKPNPTEHVITADKSTLEILTEISGKSKDLVPDE